MTVMIFMWYTVTGLIDTDIHMYLYSGTALLVRNEDTSSTRDTQIIE